MGQQSSTSISTSIHTILTLGISALLFLTSSSPAQAHFSGYPEVLKKADRNATLTFLSAAYPKTLNPFLIATAVESEITSPLFDSMMNMDPDTGEVECSLCTSYTYSKDKLTVTVQLRKDATFHDGKPVRAQDVEFSYQALLHPKVDNLNLKTHYLGTIDSVTAKDDFTVVVRFRKVQFDNIYKLGAAILPKHRFAYFEKDPTRFNKDRQFGRAPMGSGPYRFKKWVAGKYVEIERNEKWWGFKDSRFNYTYNFKKIRFKIITDSNVAFQAFKKGEYDYARLQSFDYEALTKEAKPSDKVVAHKMNPKIETGFAFLAWNNRLPIFKDAKTRHALALLTNRFETLQKFSKGLRPPTNGPWGVNSPFSCPVKECPIIPFDPKKASQLLAEAGWKDTNGDGVLDREGRPFRFTILTGEGDWARNVIGVYRTEMKKAGIEVQHKQLDWTAMNKLVDELRFEAFFSGFGGSYPLTPRQLWHSENTRPSGSNMWGFNDPKADDLIEDYYNSFDKQKRIQLAQKLHKRIYNAHPVVFHHGSGGCLFGVNKSLQGVEVANFIESCIYWPRWYKTK